MWFTPVDTCVRQPAIYRCGLLRLTDVSVNPWYTDGGLRRLTDVSVTDDLAMVVYPGWHVSVNHLFIDVVYAGWRKVYRAK